METEKDINFRRIEEAIAYIRNNFKQQPSLDEVAEHVHLSPYHFQRMFTDWAGVSPKKFLQFISTSYAKKLLKEDRLTLSQASFETGLSGTSRLHDLFVNIEGMTPAEYKNGGKDLDIHYSTFTTLFGKVIIASTAKGICHLSFYDEEGTALFALNEAYPNASITEQLEPMHQLALSAISQDIIHPHEIKLHLKGSEFQLKVWEALVNIPSGQLSTYGQVANFIQKPKAFRAVGSAVGDNPVAYIIPCHRVIRSSGEFGEYHWGSDRKTAIIGWEAARFN